MTTGVVRHACRHRVTARGVFVLGDSFTRPELGNDIGLMGALLLFVLRVVAGACVGRWTGQPRMPPRERQHEGLGGDWGILLRLDWEPLRGHGLTTGVVRHACRHRVTARGVFGLGGLFCGFVGGAVAVCFEGCCGSMCWPRERPATHAAAGAAARGVFGLGGSFHMLGSGQPTAAAGGAAARGVRGIGGFNPLRGAGAGAPIRRRHAAGATRRVLCAFCFCGGRCRCLF